METVFIFSILYISVSPTVYGDYQLDKGLVFIKNSEILVTGDKWTIVVDVNIDDYVYLVQGMNTALNTMEANVHAFVKHDRKDKPIYMSEIMRLRQLVYEIDGEVQSVRALLPVENLRPIRRKRGLINVGGTILKYLFGTMDHQDMEQINGVIEDMKAFSQSVVHTQEQQVSHVKKLNERVSRNTRNIVFMAKSMRDTINNTVNMVALTANRIMEFTAGMRDLEVAVIQARENLIRLQESLDVTALGKLSSALVSPSNLSRILTDISMQTPTGTTMLAAPLVENMYIYYQVAEVHACSTPKGIRLFIDVPLRGRDRYFEVYKPYPLPYYHPEINEFVSIRAPSGTYLAVSEDRLYFLIVTMEDLRRCHEGYYTVCPADFVMLDSKAQHCLIALYLGNDEVVQKTCKRTIENKNFDPVWIRTPGTGSWIYSLNTPVRVTRQDRALSQKNGHLTSQTFELMGTGILNDSADSFFYGPNFKLLPQFMGKSTVGLQLHTIILPPIQHLLTPNEIELFQDEEKKKTLMQNLANIASQEMDGTKVGVDISNLQQQTQRLQHVSLLHDGTVIGMGSLTLICIILMLLLIMFRHSIRTMISRWIQNRRKARRSHLTEGVVLYAGTSKEGPPENKVDTQATVEIHEHPKTSPQVTFKKHGGVSLA